LFDEDEPEEQRKSDWWEAVGGLGDLAAGADDVAGPVLAVIGLVVVTIVVAVVIAVFVLPALIFVADLLFVLVVAGVALLARILFRRPWIVVARSEAGLYEWAVVGWKASGAAIKIVKRAIARGESLDELRLRLL
jgi:hypothetical protein